MEPTEHFGIYFGYILRLFQSWVSPFKGRAGLHVFPNAYHCPVGSRDQLHQVLVSPKNRPSVAGWFKAPESDVSAGGESPVRAPVLAATLCPYA